MVRTFWLKMQEHSIILSSGPYAHEKPIFIPIILGAHFLQNDWLARFEFLHLSSIFSTFINVELSSFYETYHKLDCSLEVTVTKWIPLLLNFNSNITQYIYFCLVKSTGIFFLRVRNALDRMRGRWKGFLKREKILAWKSCSLFWAVESETSGFVRLISFVLNIILLIYTSNISKYIIIYIK